MPTTSAILTAAGESTRMGAFKPLLPWKGKALVQYQTVSLVEAGIDEIVVVLGYLKDLVIPYLDSSKIKWTFNPDYRSGRTTSIKAGLDTVSPDAKNILLLAVDQPRTPHVISAIMCSHITSKAIITVPRYKGFGGHPVVFSTTLRPEIARIPECGRGIKEVFLDHRRELNEVFINDPMVKLDLNTPDEFDRAKMNHRA